jgi:hypothetical protein
MNRIVCCQTLMGTFTFRIQVHQITSSLIIYRSRDEGNKGYLCNELYGKEGVNINFVPQPISSSVYNAVEDET